MTMNASSTIEPEKESGDRGARVRGVASMQYGNDASHRACGQVSQGVRPRERARETTGDCVCPKYTVNA